MDIRFDLGFGAVIELWLLVHPGPLLEVSGGFFCFDEDGVSRDAVG